LRCCSSGSGSGDPCAVVAAAATAVIAAARRAMAAVMAWPFQHWNYDVSHWLLACECVPRARGSGRAGGRAAGGGR
jgi:hypothetical protein